MTKRSPILTGPWINISNKMGDLIDSRSGYGFIPGPGDIYLLVDQKEPIFHVSEMAT